MEGRVSGKVAIVTGAGSTPGASGSGIGQAIATVLVREGATVLLVDLDRSRAAATLATLEGLSGKGLIFEGDVTRSTDCDAMVEAAVAEFGGLDILVNNAAISRHVSIDQTSVELYDEVLDVNLKGSFLASRSALPSLVSRGGGSIIMIGSVAGIRDSGTTHPAYCASKAGQLGLMFDLAGEYGRKNVRVNAVLPGMVSSPMQASVSRSALTDEVRSRLNLLGRMGDAWDVAHAVLFLCSDEASYVTGHIMPVDGGATAAMPGSANRASRMLS